MSERPIRTHQGSKGVQLRVSTSRQGTPIEQGGVDASAGALTSRPNKTEWRFCHPCVILRPLQDTKTLLCWHRTGRAKCTWKQPGGPYSHAFRATSDANCVVVLLQARSPRLGAAVRLSQEASFQSTLRTHWGVVTLNGQANRTRPCSVRCSGEGVLHGQNFHRISRRSYLASS